MHNRLFVGVLGHRNSGKSRTWNDLFGRTVRRGSNTQYLELRPNECVEVFLISGSFEERQEYAGDILDRQSAQIILCSMQYVENVHTTIDYIFEKKEFDIYVQWLNPGHSDAVMYYDGLGIESQLLNKKATLAIRDGKIPTRPRVQEIREFIYGWAVYRGLIFPCNGRSDSTDGHDAEA